MKTRFLFSILGVVGLLLVTGTAAASPLYDVVGTAFTYQGRLTDGGTAANGVYDFEFRFYDVESGGPGSSPVSQDDVTVTDGLFTVQLDWPGEFSPDLALFLEIRVRPGSSGGAYTILSPRQPLTPTPYALWAKTSTNAFQLDGLDAGNLAGDVPINNGTLNTNLNADMLDGLHASNFAVSSHSHWGQSWSGSGTGLTVSGGDTGLSGSGVTYGIYGQSSGPYGTGVYGISIDPTGTGVWGAGHDGVLGLALTSHGDVGVHGIAYGASGDYAGLFDGNVRIVGNSTVTGTKSAIVDTKDYGTRSLYSVESPESWFEDFGTGQLANGEAVITIEQIFAETVNLADGYHVFVTPLSDCALYVDGKSPTSFAVRAMGGQGCSTAFDYRIVAKRLGYEDVRLAEVKTPAVKPADR